MECMLSYTHKNNDFFSGIMECCIDAAAFAQLRIKKRSIQIQSTVECDWRRDVHLHDIQSILNI